MVGFEVMGVVGPLDERHGVGHRPRTVLVEEVCRNGTHRSVRDMMGMERELHVLLCSRERWDGDCISGEKSDRSDLNLGHVGSHLASMFRRLWSVAHVGQK